MSPPITACKGKSTPLSLLDLSLTFVRRRAASLPRLAAARRLISIAPTDTELSPPEPQYLPLSELRHIHTWVTTGAIIAIIYRISIRENSLPSLPDSPLPSDILTQQWRQLGLSFSINQHKIYKLQSKIGPREACLGKHIYITSLLIALNNFWSSFI